jgi:hypothetical protein
VRRLKPFTISSATQLTPFTPAKQKASVEISSFCAWKANNGYATINWRYQGKKLISFPSRKYIFHKNREISILTMKKKQQG